MFGQPPSSTRTDPPYPYTTLFRSEAEDAEAEGDVEELAAPASLDDEDNGESRDDHEGEEEATPRGKSRNGDAAADDLRRKRMALRRRYTIQEAIRSEEHTSERQSLMRISYAGFCLKKKKTTTTYT